MGLCTFTILFNYKHTTEIVCNFDNAFIISQLLDKSEDVLFYKLSYSGIDYSNKVLNHVGQDCKKLVSKFE